MFHVVVGGGGVTAFTSCFSWEGIFFPQVIHTHLFLPKSLYWPLFFCLYTLKPKYPHYIFL